MAAQLPLLRPHAHTRLMIPNFGLLQEVMKLQESKKELAGILLSQHDGDQVDTSIGVLEVSSKSSKPPATLT